MISPKPMTQSSWGTVDGVVIVTRRRVTKRVPVLEGVRRS